MIPKTIIAVAALLAAAGNAAAQGVERKQAAGAMIANATIIPANAKIYLLSGATGSPVNPADTDSPTAFGDTKVQAMSIFTKMKAQLESMGLGMGDVVKLTIFMVGDPKTGGKMDREGMTAAYKSFFGTADQPNLPARSTVQVAALGRPQTLIEIEAIAAK